MHLKHSSSFYAKPRVLLYLMNGFLLSPSTKKFFLQVYYHMVVDGSMFYMEKGEILLVAK